MYGDMTAQPEQIIDCLFAIAAFCKLAAGPEVIKLLKFNSTELEFSTAHKN